MPFYVAKTDADQFQNAERSQVFSIAERCFYRGGDLAVGDTVFIWLSGAVQRLGWSAEVIRVDREANKRISARVRLIAQPVPNAPALADIAPLRDSTDSTPPSTLAKKLYRHAHDKFAALDDAESAYLSAYFELAGAT